MLATDAVMKTRSWTVFLASILGALVTSSAWAAQEGVPPEQDAAAAKEENSASEAAPQASAEPEHTGQSAKAATAEKPAAEKPAAEKPAVVAPPAETKGNVFPPEVAPLELANHDVSIRFGLLLQPQYQRVGDNSLAGYSQDLYVRRARFMLGGTLFGIVDYFFSTDFPDLFLSKSAVGSPSIKYTPLMTIQDAFMTLRPVGDAVMLDAGYFLPPMAHNAIQGAGTLYGWDYFRFTYQHDLAFGSPQNLNPPTTPAGRDAGAELRGLVLGGHLEYRLGVFQGLRSQKSTSDVGALNGFRVTGRLQINLLEPETGFFYAGTYFGKKKIVSVGGSYDFQNGFSGGYQYYAGDVLVDLPLGPGVVTAQVNVAHWDGNQFIQANPVPNQVGFVLQRQTAVMAEAGYTILPIRVSPILRFERVDLENPHVPPQTRVGGGLAYWPFGHNLNLKAFYTRISQDAPPGSPPYHDTDQINVQGQVYFY